MLIFLLLWPVKNGAAESNSSSPQKKTPPEDVLWSRPSRKCAGAHAPPGPTLSQWLVNWSPVSYWICLDLIIRRRLSPPFPPFPPPQWPASLVISVKQAQSSVLIGWPPRHPPLPSSTRRGWSKGAESVRAPGATSTRPCCGIGAVRGVPAPQVLRFSHLHVCPCKVSWCVGGIEPH